MATDVKPGDWVRFYQAGKLVIGEVRYVTPRASWERDDKLNTDLGVVHVSSVLETRRGSVGEAEAGKDA